MSFRNVARGLQPAGQIRGLNAADCVSTEAPMSIARFAVVAAFVGSSALGVGAYQGRGAAPAATPQAAQAPQKPGDKFDPARDAERDIQAAVAEATKSKRRVMLDVGGEWCSWCHILDRYFDEHADLKQMRDKLYVWTKINFSPENENKVLLGRYPKITGYPHLFVLDADGKLLQSQDTGLLEEGPSYNYDKMQQFLLRWSGSEK
jgi:thiol:disulfide interchange protein